MNKQQFSLAETYGKLPMSFEANRGQTDPQVDFLARGCGYILFLTPAEAVLALRKPGDDQQSVGREPKVKPKRTVKAKTTVLRMKCAGSNRQPLVEGLDELPGKVNYFKSKDPDKWRTNIPTYARVRYRDVYPGVDLIYYGNRRQLEYDFVVAPGADLAAITLDFQGVEQLETDDRGDLILHTSGEQIRLRKPFIYQEVDGAKREIPGGYVLKERNRAGFLLGEYDAARPLVIDPVLVYSTYLGGSRLDEGLGIAVDLFGNAYITGDTASDDFPLQNPLQPTRGGDSDAFVSKINTFGSALVYSTYLGGSRDDFGIGIAVDLYGNAYVAGRTNSDDFPTQNPLQPALAGAPDAFVSKINAFGSALIYSTYLGGSEDDVGRGITVDLFGNAYVTGETESDDFPTPNPLQSALAGAPDAFVSKINAFGSALVYSTYLGGSENDVGRGITVDLFGNAYVTGQTNSNDFPTQNPLQPGFGGGTFDAFVSKINAFGSALVYSTYLGGSENDLGRGIAVDLSGNAYVAGRTNSDDFPTQNPLQPTRGGDFDAFVTKINTLGSDLIYSTYLGGSASDDGRGIAVDLFGNAHVTGSTRSDNFPTQNPLQPGFGGGTFDAFAAKINTFGSNLIYSTYLGGSGDDDGFGIAVDLFGNAYVTGRTDSNNFPTENPLQPDFGGGIFDAFVTKIFSSV